MGGRHFVGHPYLKWSVDIRWLRGWRIRRISPRWRCFWRISTVQRNCLTRHGCFSDRRVAAEKELKFDAHRQCWKINYRKGKTYYCDVIAEKDAALTGGKKLIQQAFCRIFSSKKKIKQAPSDNEQNQ